jgi:hypothetical protein
MNFPVDDVTALSADTAGIRNRPIIMNTMQIDKIEDFLMDMDYPPLIHPVLKCAINC